MVLWKNVENYPQIIIKCPPLICVSLENVLFQGEAGVMDIREEYDEEKERKWKGKDASNKEILATSWWNLFMPYANDKGADQIASAQSDQRLCCSLPR